MGADAVQASPCTLSLFLINANTKLNRKSSADQIDRAQQILFEGKG